MQVRMKASISGLRDGTPWPASGEVADLPDDEAVQLLNSKQAEPIESAAPESASIPAAPVKK